MLLAVDVGNTNVVLGLVAEDGARVSTMRTATRPGATVDEISLVVAHLARVAPGGSAAVTRSVICSVVPSLTGSFASYAWEELGHEMRVITGETDLGIPVALEDPRELGADRLVNAFAAIRRVGAPVIVIDLGTATTFDCVDPDGRYVGGIIAPGVETSSEELFRRAARLTRIDLTFPDRFIGHSTRDSLRAGILLGTIGMIESLLVGVRAELGGEARVLATGGLAPLIGPRCAGIDEVDVHLTLDGLVAAERQLRGA
jgi:type III pantothenate kinase